MKRDRLYGITLYLLNHGRTSAHTLAEHFEVSLRTIQRDMDALAMAKVPIIAYTGIDGGYELQEAFCMDEHWASEEEFAIMTSALQGYSSVMQDAHVEDLSEKVTQFQHEPESIHLDFKVLREHPTIYKNLKQIQQAIVKKCLLQFQYTNANGEQKQITADAAGCIYQWYSWYMIACNDKGYRMYKLVRMEAIELLEDKHGKNAHKPLKELVAQLQEQECSRPMLQVILRCDKAKQKQIMEYLPGCIREEDAQSFLYELNVPEEEHFWFANLLAFGTSIQVISPDSLKTKIYEHCKKIIQLYGEL